jgi:hypothetical protein
MNLHHLYLLLNYMIHQEQLHPLLKLHHLQSLQIELRQLMDDLLQDYLVVGLLVVYYLFHQMTLCDLFLHQNLQQKNKRLLVNLNHLYLHQ